MEPEFKIGDIVTYNGHIETVIAIDNRALKTETPYRPYLITLTNEENKKDEDAFANVISNLQSGFHDERTRDEYMATYSIPKKLFPEGRWVCWKNKSDLEDFTVLEHYILLMRKEIDNESV